MPCLCSHCLCLLACCCCCCCCCYSAAAPSLPHFIRHFLPPLSLSLPHWITQTACFKKMGNITALTTFSPSVPSLCLCTSSVHIIREEPFDSRLIQYLLRDPVGDGGQVCRLPAHPAAHPAPAPAPAPAIAPPAPAPAPAPAIAPPAPAPAPALAPPSNHAAAAAAAAAPAPAPLAPALPA